jgi:hypothetical protein
MGKRFFNSPSEIVFYQNPELKWEIPKEYYPIPASNLIPDWYKKISTYWPPIAEANKVPSKAIDRQATLTMKRCMPIFDAITSGYLITTHMELDVWYDENKNWNINWAFPAFDKVITNHPPTQFYNYKDKQHEKAAPKFDNPWHIRTEPGISCLFIPPLHRPDTGIKIIEGVVDTDTYPNAVAFPFWLDEGFEGIIPAGTPIAQVIPFRRDSFKMKIGSSQDYPNQGIYQLRSAFQGTYRNLWRTIKEYR